MNSGIDKEYFIQILLVVMFLALVFIIFSSCGTSYSTITIDKVNVEKFSQFKEGDHIDTHVKHLRIPLNAPVGDNETLLFGDVNKYISHGLSTRLDIQANLYILGGDVFNKDQKIEPIIDSLNGNVFTKFNTTEISQVYTVYVDQKYIGDMKKDGDGVYKLKIDLGIAKAKLVEIFYENNDKDRKLVLTGSF